MSAASSPQASTQALPNSAPAPSHTLLVLSGQARGARVRVQGSLRIGKAPDNDLVLPDASVSRYHCCIEEQTGGMFVRDLGSTNHTKIGPSRVVTAALEPGHTLTLGDVQLMLTPEESQARVPASEHESFGTAVGRSLAMRGVFGLLERIAPTDATVLLEGETGTGKDVLARSIHASSPRVAEPFVVVDCGAVSYNLIESEFFGHEKGAFTGAIQARAGAFECARKGTLFLDEIGELPLDVQPKLLRVIETGEFRRVGGNRSQRCQARVLAATKRDLKEEVRRGKFREDLYFRLAVVPVQVPPLRSRREDIPLLAAQFLQQAQQRDTSLPNLKLDDATLSSLMAHDWPGNVRELRNVLDRSVYIASATREPRLQVLDLQLTSVASESQPAWCFRPGVSYRDAKAELEAGFERAFVEWLMGQHQGNVSAAARSAKMDRKYLHELAKRHGFK